MATTNEIVSIAQATAEVSRLMKSAKSIVDQVLERNVVEAITWGGDQDADLAAAGLDYSGAEVSNAIGSAAAFQTFWATHGGNFEKLTAPIT